MPKLYEYLGIIVFFYSNEHEPVHVHGRYQGRESKIELVIEDGKVVDAIVHRVKGKRPLASKQLADFERLVRQMAQEIVQKWVDYFVYNKKVKYKKIEGRL